jgi:hypothetical protein
VFQHATRLQYPRALGQQPVGFRDMLEHVKKEHCVKRRVGERQLLRVQRQVVRSAPRRDGFG